MEKPNQSRRRHVLEKGLMDAPSVYRHFYGHDLPANSLIFGGCDNLASPATVIPFLIEAIGNAAVLDILADDAPLTWRRVFARVAAFADIRLPRALDGMDMVLADFELLASADVRICMAPPGYTRQGVFFLERKGVALACHLSRTGICKAYLFVDYGKRFTCQTDARLRAINIGAFICERASRRAA